MAISGCKVIDFESSSSARFDLVKGSEKKSAASKLMSIVPEDILVEIFLRLPNGRSVIQCAIICKRWYSIIIKPSTRSYFVEYQLLKQHLDSSYYPSYSTSVLFNYNTGKHYQLSSLSLRLRPKHYDLSFMRNWEDLIIRASSGYFLLLNRGANQYYICNSLTRHCLVLPEAPSLNIIWGSYSYALICDPLDVEEEEDEPRYSYSVVIVCNCQFFWNKYECKVVIFDSVTRLWTKNNFSMPYKTSRRSVLGFDGTYMDLTIYLNHYIVVPKNGVLHWLQGMECLVVFDPSSFKFRHIHLPINDQFSGISPEYGKCEVQLGMVQDRVRLSVMHESDSMCTTLKVWELDSSCFSWILVHNFVVTEINTGDAMCFVLAFDPCNGNVLFLVRGQKIYSYEIDQHKYKEICDFPFTLGPTLLTPKDNLAWRFGVLTLVHPLWPLPSANRS